MKDSVKDGGWRKLLVPGAASLVGAGAGLALTRGQSLRRTLPSLDDVGIGDLADDLRTKLNSVIGKDDTGKRRRTTTASSKPLSSSELEARRSRRQQRRKQRAGR